MASEPMTDEMEFGDSGWIHKGEGVVQNKYTGEIDNEDDDEDPEAE